MKVEIWSDIVCPFCYIGKRRFEQALAQFPHSEKVAIHWKSFQLNPGLKAGSYTSLSEYLAESKGWTPEHVQQMHTQVEQMAAAAGLHYRLDQAVVANTFDAHRLMHLAASRGLEQEASERLFRAYFTEGKQIGSADVLVQLGTDIGLDAAETRAMLSAAAFRTNVEQDMAEAQALGIQSVPFFVFNRQYAVSGAQPSATFLEVLQQVWEEQQQQVAATLPGTASGDGCSTDEGCVSA